jgi:hypothetical protein
MALSINRKLNLVIDIEGDQGPMHVHSVPIGRATFERYYYPIARAFAEIYKGQLGVFSGPRVAYLTLREIAQNTETWDGPAGVKNGLVGEIRRLTNVAVPGPAGWQTLMYDDAVKEGRITEDDDAEVMNALVFFTLASSMHNHNDRPKVLKTFLGFWGGSLTSLNSTEFAASLATSKPAASIGVKMG